MKDTLVLLALGGVLGLASRLFPMSGRAALALALVPLVGLACAFTFC